MTKVNFYQLKGDTDAILNLSCQLAEQAWQQNSDVLIYVPDEQTLQTLDERLWTWSASSFLPHSANQCLPKQGQAKPHNQNQHQTGPESIGLCLAHPAQDSPELDTPEQDSPERETLDQKSPERETLDQKSSEQGTLVQKRPEQQTSRQESPGQNSTERAQAENTIAEEHYNDYREFHGLLINLAAHTPHWFSRFERVHELVYGDEDHFAAKRNRYKFYKGRGYPLSYHDMTDRC